MKSHLSIFFFRSDPLTTSQQSARRPIHHLLLQILWLGSDVQPGEVLPRASNLHSHRLLRRGNRSHRINRKTKMVYISGRQDKFILKNPKRRRIKVDLCASTILGPGFESQAHLRFLNLLLNCDVSRTKKLRRGRDWPI